MIVVILEILKNSCKGIGRMVEVGIVQVEVQVGVGRVVPSSHASRADLSPSPHTD